MIFVTVGAYDLPFNRLIIKISELNNLNLIYEEVFMQIGHSIVPNADIPYKRFLSFERMNEKADKADIIITHGGPGSIMLALTKGKIPIVVPRQKKFGEMVDDHQIFFTRRLQEKKKILVVYDVDDLLSNIKNYRAKVRDFKVRPKEIEQNANEFASKLEKMLYKKIWRKESNQ